jgi:hypothetical protein
MKKIDSRFRHLSEEDALEAMTHVKKLEEAPTAYKNYLKEDYYSGAKETREDFVRQDRRRFLDLITKSGISVGLLKSSALMGSILASRHVLAQDATNKRVVFCYLNSGAAAGAWMPSSATQMNQITQPYGPTGYAVSDICHFRQVDVVTSGHATALNSLGVTDYNSPTMDKRIAAVLGSTTPRSSIYLGAKATTNGTLCSNIGPCQDSPTQALADIFSGSSGGGGGGGTTPDTTYALSYDAQLRALESIKSKLSTEEYARYQEHIDSLKKIKTNLANQNSSSTPTTTNCGSTITPSMANMQATGKSQADIIVAAFACGITKVATLQLGNHQGDWVGHSTAYKQDAHQACHAKPPSQPGDFIEMWRYLNDVPAYLVDKLRKTPGPDGQPLINSTVFVQVTCMGNGMDHTSGNGPFIVATKMSGFASGFSARQGGNVYDLNGAIPKGMGLSGISLGSSTLGLV